MDATLIDEKIQHAIHLALLRISGVDHDGLVVAVKAGVATLSGHVAEASVRQAAEQVTRRVLGVRSVANEIQVRRPLNDTERGVNLDRALLNAFDRKHQDLD